MTEPHTPAPTPVKKRRLPGTGWPFLLLVAIAIGVLAYRAGSTAPVPPAFSKDVALDDALDRAEASGKPVLALATADWCGPCQRLKRGPLADPTVADLIADRTEPAYVDVTDSDDPAAIDAATRLGIGPIPVLVLIDDGQELARLEGAVSTERLTTWLESALRVAPATEQQPADPP